MSERDLILIMLRLIIGVGLVYGLLFARPRLFSRYGQRARGWQALLVRIVLALWLLAIIGYFGIFLPRFQQNLFDGKRPCERIRERTLCPTFA